jgi:hypothetical protein
MNCVGTVRVRVAFRFGETIPTAMMVLGNHPCIQQRQGRYPEGRFYGLALLGHRGDRL